MFFGRMFGGLASLLSDLRYILYDKDDPISQLELYMASCDDPNERQARLDSFFHGRANSTD